MSIVPRILANRLSVVTLFTTIVLGCGASLHPQEFQPDVFSSEPPSGGKTSEIENLFAQEFDARERDFSGQRAGTVGLKCLSAAEALRNAKTFSGSYRQDLFDTMVAAADHLVKTSTPMGWERIEGAFDAFSDGTWNSAATVYTVQSGSPAWCLSEAASIVMASDLSKAKSYQQLSRQVHETFRTTAFIDSTSNEVRPCPQCGYFWYSQDRNDRGRYVKNANIDMGTSFLADNLFSADPTIKLAGVAAVDSQYEEVADSNFDYLGQNDPEYVNGGDSWDDHNGRETWLLLRAGEILQEKKYMCQAFKHYKKLVKNGTQAAVFQAAVTLLSVLPMPTFVAKMDLPMSIWTKRMSKRQPDCL